MSLINNVAPGGVVSGVLANVQPLAVLQAQGAAGASPTAKLLLQSAVTSATLVPNYQPEGQRNKPALRLVSNQPSSALAAQYIAQSPELSSEEIELFARREAPQTQTAPGQPQVPEQAESFVAPRTQTPAAPLNAPQANTTPIAVAVASSATANPQAAALNTGLRPSTNSESRASNAPSVGSTYRRSGFAHARGATAYDFAVTAHKTVFTERAVEAVG